MEELQSTDVLDFEILEDARKKALRILKQAEDTIAVQNTQWEKKITEAVCELEEKHTEHIKTENERIMARLPIDKLRIKIEKIEALLLSSAEDWYKNLNQQQVLDLLSTELSKLILHCEKTELTGNIIVKSFGIEKKEIEIILKKANLSSSDIQFSLTSEYPSIILETGNLQITVSLKNIINTILNEKRSELAEALVGKTFLECAV